MMGNLKTGAGTRSCSVRNSCLISRSPSEGQSGEHAPSPPSLSCEGRNEPLLTSSLVSHLPATT